MLSFNKKEKKYIENLIYNINKFKPILEILNTGNLLLRNLENVQGDEANLVIISIAYDKNANLSQTYVGGSSNGKMV